MSSRVFLIRQHFFATALMEICKFPSGFFFELVEYTYLMPSSAHFGFFWVESNQVIVMIKVLNNWKHIYFIHEEASVPFT